MGSMSLITAEAVTGISGMAAIFTDLLSQAPTFIQFCLTTFPINVGVAVSLAGMVTAFIYKLKPSAR